MFKIRKKIVVHHMVMESKFWIDFYTDCLIESERELMEYLSNGYEDDNMEKLLDNCLYYSHMLKMAHENLKKYSQMAKGLGL